ncbi:MAG: hypothetical protein H0S85_01610 [Desulfovibrionaceae bacterium]|jgi:hypothetical protein|nr:hypothetical protein [Desulfovibrionaceae bacterium]
MKRFLNGCTAVLALLATLGAAGCYSPKPIGVTYDMTTQHKVQAAQHWDVLAADVASQIQMAMEARDDLVFRPIFVQQPNESPFAKAFHRLLVSQLVFRGLQVSVEEEDSLSVNYQVMGVRHGKKGFDLPPGALTTLPLGILAFHNLESANGLLSAASAAGLIVDMGRSYYAGPTSTEIVVTVEMTFNNRYVVHTSSIYYLDPAEIPIYREPMGGGTPTEPMMVKLVTE